MGGDMHLALSPGVQPLVSGGPTGETEPERVSWMVIT